MHREGADSVLVVLLGAIRCHERPDPVDATLAMKRQFFNLRSQVEGGLLRGGGLAPGLLPFVMPAELRQLLPQLLALVGC